ncbi:hypothetical protein FQR65_LT17682 [Abscondita terminalis]|nr:hypothetical protein FQR65_LT17682 [Abscondita terminalis]
MGPTNLLGKSDFSPTIQFVHQECKKKLDIKKKEVTTATGNHHETVACFKAQSIGATIEQVKRKGGMPSGDSIDDHRKIELLQRDSIFGALPKALHGDWDLDLASKHVNHYQLYGNREMRTSQILIQ